MFDFLVSNILAIVAIVVSLFSLWTAYRGARVQSQSLNLTLDSTPAVDIDYDKPKWIKLIWWRFMDFWNVEFFASADKNYYLEGRLQNAMQMRFLDVAKIHGNFSRDDYFVKLYFYCARIQKDPPLLLNMD